MARLNARPFSIRSTLGDMAYWLGMDTRRYASRSCCLTVARSVRTPIRHPFPRPVHYSNSGACRLSHTTPRMVGINKHVTHSLGFDRGQGKSQRAEPKRYRPRQGNTADVAGPSFDSANSVLASPCCWYGSILLSYRDWRSPRTCHNSFRRRVAHQDVRHPAHQRHRDWRTVQMVHEVAARRQGYQEGWLSTFAPSTRLRLTHRVKKRRVKPLY